MKCMAGSIENIESEIIRMFYGRVNEFEEGKIYVHHSGEVHVLLKSGSSRLKVFYKIGSVALVDGIDSEGKLSGETVIAYEDIWTSLFKEAIKKIYSRGIDVCNIVERYIPDNADSGYIGEYEALNTDETYKLFNKWVAKLKLINDEVYMSL